MKISGIDTLEIGLEIEEYEENFENFLMKLDELKNMSQINNRKETIIINESSFFVSPKGQGIYRYKIENQQISICFMIKQIQNTPSIYIRFSSFFLWELGYNQAYNVFMQWFHNSFNVNITNVKISRVDICFDTDEISFNERDIEKLYSRAIKMEQKYADDIYYNRKVFSGFVIGKGSDLSCRIYNKTLEIKNSNKLWFENIWKELCWKGTSNVWRIEFQIRKKVLKELDIKTIEDIDDRLVNIWSYLTQKWLIMKQNGKDSNKSRWKVTNKWKAIQKADFDYVGNASVRNRLIKGERDKLIAQCGGILLSITALANSNNISSSFLEVMELLKDKAEKNDTTIIEEIEKRKYRFFKD